MKRLYVGCRVRVVDYANMREFCRKFIGMQGVISGRCDCGLASCNYWEVSDMRNEHNILIGWHPDALEPIQDPGHQVISWADMADLWTPSGVEA